MFGGGAGSEFMRQIVAPMVGGMVSATILTLVVIPAVFLLRKSNSILTCANKRFDFQVLSDPFKEQFNLPPGFVNICDCFCRQLKIIR